MKGVRSFIACGVLCVCAAVMGAHADSVRERVEKPVPLATVNVGIEGKVMYRVPHEDGRAVRLRAAKTDRLSGAVVWIAEERDEATETVYDVRFVPNIPGEFDLSGLFERVDGKSIERLPELNVSVWSVLPETHDGILAELARPRAARLGGYWLALIGVGALWVGAAVVWVVVRMMRRRAPEIVLPTPPRTLADQLRELVDAVLSGNGDRETKARLEMLLLTFWRERLGLEGLEHAEALRVLHKHAEAGAILREVEGWLHSPRSEAERVTPREVEVLLEPYRSHRPLLEMGSSASRGAGTPAVAGGVA